MLNWSWVLRKKILIGNKKRQAHLIITSVTSANRRSTFQTVRTIPRTEGGPVKELNHTNEDFADYDTYYLVVILQSAWTKGPITPTLPVRLITHVAWLSVVCCVTPGKRV